MKTTVIFPIAIMIIMALLHIGICKRVVKRLDVSKRVYLGIKIFVILNFIGIIGYIVGRYFITISNDLYFIFSTSLGIGFLFFVTIVLYEFVHILQHSIPFDNSKREFFKKSSDIGVVAVSGAYWGGAIYGGQKEPIIIDINLNQNLFEKPYKIVQISDMHIGGLIDEEFVKKSVKRINNLDADFITITGDLIDLPVKDIKDCLSHLSNLKSKFGTFYIVGNHEYFHGIEDAISYVKSIGITVLENNSIEVGDKNRRFNIAGLYDYFGYKVDKFIPDTQKVKKSLTPNIPTLLLMHQPKQIIELDNLKPNLILSGHTHGGQIFPFSYLVKLNQIYVKGLHKLSNKEAIYVNSGIGFWGPKMRLGSSSEITLIYWS